MGWWKISENMVNGDGPADIMGNALEDISKEWQREQGRKPYLKELKAVFEFSLLDELVSEPCPDEEVATNGGIAWDAMGFADFRKFTERN